MFDFARDQFINQEHRTDTLLLDGNSLSLQGFERFVGGHIHARVSPHLDDNFFNKSITVVDELLSQGRKIYGVNTLFGGLANQEAMCEGLLQEELILSHLSGVGAPLADEDVKGAMLLRANSLCHGVSGIRKAIVDRYVFLANNDCLPLVHEYGSIGASGDLIPLSAMAGAACGISETTKLKYNGEYTNAKTVLKKLGLTPFTLQPKEGLALINGTSVLTSIAANNCIKISHAFSLHMHIQILIAEVMQCDINPFNAFIHKYRPHPGQVLIASILREALESSELIQSLKHVEKGFSNNELIQDRYSLRCMPQYLGAIIEELFAVERTIKIEMNGATDNPLINSDDRTHLHGGNFLGQHVGMSMDKQRSCIGLLAKHNEAQLCLLVEPSFSKGLPPSLVDETGIGRHVGIKPLQILSNSLTPLLEHKANPLCTHFPVHAEQFNQNLNSQAYGSAQLTRESIQIFQKQLAVMCIVAAQAATLRALQVGKPTSELYSHHSQNLLQSIGSTLGCELSGNKALITTSSNGQYSNWLETLTSAIEQNKLPCAKDIGWGDINL